MKYKIISAFALFLATMVVGVSDAHAAGFVMSDTLTSPVALDEDETDGQVTYLYGLNELKDMTTGMVISHSGTSASRLVQLHDETYTITKSVLPILGHTYQLTTQIYYITKINDGGIWTSIDSGIAKKHIQVKTIPYNFS